MDKTSPNKPVAVFQDLSCCGSDTKTDSSQQPLPQLSIPMAGPPGDDAPCCGPKPGPPSSPHERPGYTLLHFVDDFVDSAAGPVARIKTSLQVKDIMGTTRPGWVCPATGTGWRLVSIALAALQLIHRCWSRQIISSALTVCVKSWMMLMPGY